ncbi:MAG: arylesterase [Halobacteriovoraceae bacterium]|nr:arylesterase [Halobacteriovoraceae bacterium]
MKIISTLLFLTLTLTLTLSLTTFSKDTYSKDTYNILFLGDSLTEGYGVPTEKAYPALVKKRLETNSSKKVEIFNLGVSGSTTSSGLMRLKWITGQKKIDLMILALGANDGLRGIPLKKSRQNLVDIILFAKEKKIKIILAGMKIPPNYGEDYRSEFEKVFKDLARTHKVTFLPFLLKDVAGVKTLNLPDGIHPNEKGHEIVAQTVFNILKDFVK